ncbi:hypothetical protein FRC08_001718 [Ceratobasidium sp. 394]|nr:hypothetical protein FRC08_001718 [Ceratobasidium sp. 394]
MPPKPKNTSTATAKPKPSAKPKDPKPKSTKAAPKKVSTMATALVVTAPAVPTSPEHDAASPEAEEVKDDEELEEGPSNKAGHRGCLPGATNFSEAQKFTMLDTIKELGAISSEYFELVAQRLNEIYKTKRNGDGCRRQYEKEAKEKPTGDPDYPELFECTIEVSWSIAAHAGVVSLRDRCEALKAFTATTRALGEGDGDEGSGPEEGGNGDDREAGEEQGDGKEGGNGKEEGSQAELEADPEADEEPKEHTTVSTVAGKGKAKANLAWDDLDREVAETEVGKDENAPTVTKAQPKSKSSSWDLAEAARMANGGPKIVELKASKAQRVVVKPKLSAAASNKATLAVPAKPKKIAVEGKVGTSADVPIYVLSQDPPIVIHSDSSSSSVAVLNDDEFQNNNKGAGQKRKASTSKDTPSKKVALGSNELETPYQTLTKSMDPKHLMEFSDHQSISNFFGYTISAKDQQIASLQAEIRAEHAAKEAIQQELNNLRMESRLGGLVKSQVSAVLGQLGISGNALPSARAPLLGTEGLGANPHVFGANPSGPTQPLGWQSNTGTQANPAYMGAAGPFQGIGSSPFAGASQGPLPTPATSFAPPDDGRSFNAGMSASEAPL